MKIQVQLFAHLIKYAPEGKSSFFADLEQDASVGKLIRILGIPLEESRIIIVNGRHCEEDRKLNDGDEVAIMTPVEGG